MTDPYTGVIADQTTLESMRRLKDEISNFHSAWTYLENQLSELLNLILGYDKNKTKMAFAVFYSPTSIETQLTLLSNCLGLLIEERAYDLRTLDLWKKVYERISECRKDRNFIAHSSVHVLTDGKDKFARLTSPLTDVSRWNKLPHRHKAHKSLPGYGDKEVHDKYVKVANSAELAQDFAGIISALVVNDGTFPEKLQKLDDRLQP